MVFRKRRIDGHELIAPKGDEETSRVAERTLLARCGYPYRLVNIWRTSPRRHFFQLRLELNRRRIERIRQLDLS